MTRIRTSRAPWRFKMLRHFFLFFIFLFAVKAAAQNKEDVVIYLDSLESVTDSSHCDFVRILKNFHGTERHCAVYDFYKSGQRKMTGTYSDKFEFRKTGPFISYFENGKMASIINYTNDLPVGKCYFWHENGRKKAQCEFVMQGGVPVLKVEQCWSRIDIQRVVDGKGHFEDQDLTSFSEGELLGGFKHGQWWGTDYKDQFTFVENYRKGKLISGVSTDSTGISHKYKSIYTAATPKKGIAHFEKYVEKSLLKRKDLKNENQSVTVHLRFVVRPDGELSDFEILSYEDSQIDEALVEIFKSYGKWIPARSRGIETDTFFMLPIELRRY